MKHEEDQLQIVCVEWFRIQYPTLAHLLFHVPNGGSRALRISKSGARFSPEAQRLKKMGIRPGVSDLFLMLPNAAYHGLWIEMKARDGKMSPEQIKFQEDASQLGFDVAVVRKFEQFKVAVDAHIFNQ